MKLTTDQKRFAIFSAASLVAVLIIFFLVYGLQDIDFDARKESRFQSNLAAQRDATLQSMYDDQRELEAAEVAYITAFPEEALVDTQAIDFIHIAMLEEVAGLFDISLETKKIDSNAKVSSAAAACEQILEKKLRLKGVIEKTYLPESLGYPELQGALATILSEVRDVQLPALNKCANA
jgi:hypothetical protein